MRKSSTCSALSECIVHGLLLLLQESPLEEITVKEIVEKAGVNRSTYYRHFSSKADVVRHYYSRLLDEYLRTVPDNVPLKNYYVGLFLCFLRHKDELLLLEKHGLSHHLLEEMDARINQIHGCSLDAVTSLYGNYHMGGIFNCFRYWLKEEMATPPEKLAQAYISFLPKDSSPFLLKKRSF